MIPANPCLKPIVLITVLFLLAPRLAPVEALAADNGGVCADAAAKAERALRLPRMLLHAVSLAESGRWHKTRRASFAWPWTVTAGGEGKFYPDRASAVAAVKRLRSEGVRNIDVGCMQINLMYHDDAFDNIEDALDPAANARYAAGFLTSLRKKAGNWAHAVARYHAGNWGDRGRSYWRRVHRLWNAERRRDFRDRRDRQRAAYLLRRKELAGR